MKNEVDEPLYLGRTTPSQHCSDELNTPAWVQLSPTEKETTFTLHCKHCIRAFFLPESAEPVVVLLKYWRFIAVVIGCPPQKKKIGTIFARLNFIKYWPIFHALMIALLKFFSRLWLWNKFKIWSIFDEVEAYRKLCQFFDHTVGLYWRLLLQSPRIRYNQPTSFKVKKVTVKVTGPRRWLSEIVGYIVS